MAAVLVIEGQERPLQAWDLVHCPPNTEHVIVGADDGPCVFIGAGARRLGRAIVYRPSEVAAKHGAAVAAETTSPQEAYSPFAPLQPGSAPEFAD